MQFFSQCIRYRDIVSRIFEYNFVRFSYIHDGKFALKAQLQINKNAVNRLAVNNVNNEAFKKMPKSIGKFNH